MTIYLLWWQIKLHILIATATLHETISLLKDDLRNKNKQLTIDNLIDVKNFTVTENKYTRNKEQDTNVGSKEKMMWLVSY